MSGKAWTEELVVVVVVREYWPGSVKLGCAFIKHNYWYLLPIIDPICQIRFHCKCAMEMDCPLYVLTHARAHANTPSYPVIYAMTMHRHSNKQWGLWSLGTFWAKFVLG